MFSHSLTPHYSNLIPYQNINEIGSWLQAAVYESHYRPIPLSEYLVFENEVYDEHGRNTAHIPVSDLKILKDPVVNATVSLVWGCVVENNSALVFCSSKDNSETMAVSKVSMKLKDCCIDVSRSR